MIKVNFSGLVYFLVVFVMCLSIIGCPNMPTTYQLTVSSSPSEGGQISMNPPGGRYSAGTLVNLIATPNAGWQFVKWNGNVLSTGDADTFIALNNNEIVTAVFIEDVMDEGEGEGEDEEPEGEAAEGEGEPTVTEGEGEPAVAEGEGEGEGVAEGEGELTTEGEGEPAVAEGEGEGEGENRGDVYVSESTGSDETGDGSKSNSWQTISHAIEQAPGSAGLSTNIHVATGTYVENLVPTSYQKIIGGYNVTFSERHFETSDDRERPGYTTVIDGNHASCVISIADRRETKTQIEVSGFVIMNGFQSSGGGIYIGSANNIHIHHNTIRENIGDYEGGGIGVFSNEQDGGEPLSGIIISHNLISNNSCGGITPFGGGGVIASAGLFDSNIIVDNQTSSCGGGVLMFGGEIRGGEIARNSAQYVAGGLLYDSRFCIVTDVAISDNISNADLPDDCYWHVADIHNITDLSDTLENDGRFYGCH